MKKLLVILLMTLCASAMAQRHHGGGYWGRGYGGGWQWMVPRSLVVQSFMKLLVSSQCMFSSP